MQTSSGKFWARPATRLGWWAIGLAVASFLLGFLWLFLPGGALISFLCGLAGGVIALIAIIRQQERSWLVWLSILPMINVFVFVIAEFLFPH
jgi:multisubunit Na+/H+ antiporter MnhB subunit